MSRPYLVLAFLILSVGCSGPKQTMLEFRLAENTPAPGLVGMALDPTGERFYLHEEVLVNQADVDSAFVSVQSGRSVVELVLTPVGAREFEELTERNAGKQCGIVLDGRLVSAPRIMAPIRNGHAMIVGDFTEVEARSIAQGLSKP